MPVVPDLAGLGAGRETYARAGLAGVEVVCWAGCVATVVMVVCPLLLVLCADIK